MGLRLAAQRLVLVGRVGARRSHSRKSIGARLGLSGRSLRTSQRNRSVLFRAPTVEVCLKG
jgi:hypothetical protein